MSEHDPASSPVPLGPSREIAEVTITVNVAGTLRTFTADTTTTGTASRAAEGLLDALRNEAAGWLREMRWTGVA